MKNYHSKKIMHPTQVVLRVRNLLESERFYRDLMGFKVIKREEDRVYFSANGRDTILVLHGGEHILAKAPRRTGLYHMAILLPDALQLGLFLKHLVEEEYPLVGGSNHGVSQALYLDDLDGNGIEVYADLDDARWQRDEKRVEMTTLPLDYEGLIGATGHELWQGMPEATKLGHIHLHVSDLDRAKEFYLEGLGFDLVSEMRSSAVFTSSEGYHHHIAFNIWAGRGAAPLDNNMAGMDYFVLEIPSEKEKTEKIDRLRALGFEIWQDGENTFTRDPSYNGLLLRVAKS